MSFKRKFNDLFCSLMITMLFVGTASAQQPASTVAANSGALPAATPPAEENTGRAVSREDLLKMMATIERLEGRIKELEAKLKKNDPSTVNTLQSPVLVTENTSNASASPAKTKAREQSDDSLLSFFEGTELSGFVDTYYGFNFNNPRGNTDTLVFDNLLRNFDTKHNQFSLNMFKLALEKKPTEDSRLGFRADLAFGPATEIVHATEPGGLNFVRNIQQAYLSYLAPVGKGLQIDVGKFVTHSGLELIETKDNFNYSRSLIFALGPYYHFGVKATYPLTDKITVMGGITNGWNNVVENNRRRTFIAQIAYKPTSKLAIIHNYTGGPEQANNIEDTRHLFDGIVSYAATPKLNLVTNYIYGWDTLNGARVHWKAIAGYAKYQVTDKFAIAPRFEYFDDHDGAPFLTGVAQRVKGVTLTSEYILNKNLITRFEYRHDFSDQNYFLRGDRPVKNQDTLTLGLVYYFSTKNK